MPKPIHHPMKTCGKCGSDEITCDMVHNGVIVIGMAISCWECGDTITFVMEQCEPFTIHHDNYQIWMEHTTMGKIVLDWDETNNMWMFLE
jgi:hypothetical protein